MRELSAEALRLASDLVDASMPPEVAGRLPRRATGAFPANFLRVARVLLSAPVTIRVNGEPIAAFEKGALKQEETVRSSPRREARAFYGEG